MAGSLNKVCLLGYVGKDPESRSFQNGGKVVNFTLATSESWKDRASGEKREKTEWHNVVVRNEKLGEVVETYVKKGSQLYIEGKIESRKYTSADGVEKYITEIILGVINSNLVMIGGKGAGEDGGQGQRQERQQPRATPDYGYGGGGGGGGGRGGQSPGWDTGRGGAGDLDDEIPFVHAEEFYIGDRMFRPVI